MLKEQKLSLQIERSKNINKQNTRKLSWTFNPLKKYIRKKKDLLRKNGSSFHILRIMEKNYNFMSYMDLNLKCNCNYGCIFLSMHININTIDIQSTH